MDELKLTTQENRVTSITGNTILLNRHTFLTTHNFYRSALKIIITDTKVRKAL